MIYLITVGVFINNCKGWAANIFYAEFFNDIPDKKVFPAPRLPFRTTTSPDFKLSAKLKAKSIVSSSEQTIFIKGYFTIISVPLL